MSKDKEAAVILDGLEAEVEEVARKMEALQIENRRLASAIVKVKNGMKYKEKKEGARSIEVGDRVLFCKKATAKNFNGIGVVTKVTSKCVFIKDENDEDKYALLIRRAKTNVKLK